MTAEILVRMPDYFPSLIDAMQDGFVLRSTSGRIVEVNQRFCDLVGFSRSDVIGQMPPHPWWPEEEAATFEAVRAKYQAGTPAEDDLVFRHRDGHRIHVSVTSGPLRDPDGSIIGFIGTVRDITERKRSEEAQQFLAEASAILGSSLDYRTTLDSVAHLAVPRLADWCAVDIVEADDRVARVSVAHVDPDKVQWARELRERYPHDPNAPAGLAYVLRTQRPELYSEITDDQLVAVARDDEQREIARRIGFTSIMIVPLIARNRAIGAISFVSAESGRHYTGRDLALAEDLARRAAVAVDNARLFEEARAATRARDQFLAVAAHELRSPLTATKGFAQLLLRRAQRRSGSEEWIVPLRTLDNQVDRVVQLVNRLLDVSRIRENRLALQLETVDLLEVAREVIGDAQLGTDRHRIRLKTAHQSLSIVCDRLRVSQVMANLLDNATKYSPKGGPVEVEVQLEGDRVIVRVIDAGIGISHTARRNLFERSFRAETAEKSTSEGMGLGLYVAKGIVQAHDGRMWVESIPGQGSTFSFTLPVHGPRLHQPAQSPQ